VDVALTVTLPPSPAWYITVVPLSPFDGTVVDVVDGIDVDVLDGTGVDVVEAMDVVVDESSVASPSSARVRIRTRISPSSISALNWILVVPFRKSASTSTPVATSPSTVQPGAVSVVMTDSTDPSDEIVIVPASATWYTTASFPSVVGDDVDVVDEADVVLTAAIPTPTAMSTATMLAIDMVEILLIMFEPPVWADRLGQECPNRP
jgi:hypothetical protein